MFAAALLTVAALLPAAIAGPVNPAARSLSKRDLKAYAEEVTIHSSCNVTQSRQLQKALADTFEITAFAQKCKPISYCCFRETLLMSITSRLGTDIYQNGPSDPVYQLYFGTGDSVVALGAYENLMRSNKEGVILRCDDPDGSE